MFDITLSAVIPMSHRTKFGYGDVVQAVVGKPEGTVVANKAGIVLIPNERLKLGNQFKISRTFELVPVAIWDAYDKHQDEEEKRKAAVKQAMNEFMGGKSGFAKKKRKGIPVKRGLTQLIQYGIINPTK